MSTPRTKARTFLGRLARDKAGNTLVMMTMFIIPILLMAGTAVDGARVYYVKTRLQQACDAGALAGRKFMIGEQFAGIPEERAKTFFANNFADGMFGAGNTTFVPSRTSDNQVRGVADTDVPLTLMGMVSKEPIHLNVTCQARFELPNLDVMFVLDTTGSMSETNPGDSAPKIQGLRDATINFYDTVETSKQPGTQIRYGFVPYATNVNVGMLLQRDWMKDNWVYQSRDFDSWVEQTSTSTSSTKNTKTTTNGSYNRTSYTVSPEKCVAPANENYSSVYSSGTFSDDGTTRTWWERSVTNGTSYSASGNASSCTITKTVYNNYEVYNEKATKQCSSNCTTKTTVAQWNYAPTTYPVSVYKGNRPDGLMAGNDTVQFQIGDGYKPVTVPWNASNACIEERKTVKQTTYPTIPTDAWDLDVDRIPTTSDPDTQWAPALGKLIYLRNNFDNTASVLSTANFTKIENYANGAYNTCPSPARRLAEMRRDDVVNYVNALQARGSTYHDIGFLWGLRLLSPTGLFAADNAKAPNGTEISRHVIFMTDGQTQTSYANYEAYGISALDRRRTSSNNRPSDSTQNQIVENRLTALCTAAKQRNITVWVIAFGTTLTPLLSNCANSGKAFQANNTAELNAAFSNIASQIAKLRVSK
jgi:Flp pilus assembly protein TadG